MKKKYLLIFLLWIPISVVLYPLRELFSKNTILYEAIYTLIYVTAVIIYMKVTKTSWRK